MRSVHTHYDNLKISRDAPKEVVRAAYRALAQKHHPDINPSPDAARVMKILNEAWEVLGDENRRKEHDQWISEQEGTAESDSAREDTRPKSKSGQQTYTYNTSSQSWKWEKNQSPPKPPPKRPSAPPKSTYQPDPPPRPERTENELPRTALDRFNTWLANADTKTYLKIGAAVAFGLYWISSGKTPTATQSPPIAAYQPPAPPVAQAPPPSTRGLFDDIPTKSDNPPHKAAVVDPWEPVSEEPAVRWSPNGKPWPNGASYLRGLPQRATGGLSKLTIDNTNGGSNVYVKLCRASNTQCDGLRHVYIPLGSSFTINAVAPGTYDIRYRDLNSGQIAKSEPMTFSQVEEDSGTKYSVIRLTLYRVADGNTSFSPLTEDQF